MKRETTRQKMRQKNYHYRRVFSTVFFCALFAAAGLFLSASSASADFRIDLSPSSGIIDQGGSVSFLATATCTTTTPSCEPETFTISNLSIMGSTATYTFSTPNCTPTCSTFVTINSGNTSYGFYNLNVQGVGATQSTSTSFKLTIGYNVKGWAWSDGIGWISFNSENCDTNWNRVMDSGDAPLVSGCPSIGTAIPQYGVHLDLGTFILSGSAWSEHIGWITFNKLGVGGAGIPPFPPFNDNAQSYIAKYNITSGMIDGWARATSCPSADCGTDWGWIKMSGTASDGSPYGAHHISNGVNNEFDGFAWGDKVLSWISFNSSNTGAVYPYKVWINGDLPNGLPTASNLAASFDRCGAGRNPTFTFDYRDPVEHERLAQYTINIYKQGVVPPVDTILVPAQFDVSGNLVPKALDGEPVSKVYTGSSLLYGNDTYYFTVTVQDQAHLNITNPSSLPVFTSPNFKMDPHQRPQFVNSPAISWSPSAPFASSTVTFSASSTVYVGALDPTEQVAATLGNSTYLWTIPGATPNTSASLSPSVVYPTSGNFNVTVQVKDGSAINACYNSDSSVSEPCSCSYAASGASGVIISKAKPVFREVKP